MAFLAIHKSGHSDQNKKKVMRNIFFQEIKFTSEHSEFYQNQEQSN